MSNVIGALIFTTLGVGSLLWPEHAGQFAAAFSWSIVGICAVVLALPVASRPIT